MIFSRRIFAAVALLCAFFAPAYAQKTKASIITEIPQLCPSGQTSGQCTATNAQNIWKDIVNSIMPTAPVVSGNFACFNGTTGLLQDCGSAPLTAQLANTVYAGPSSGPSALPTFRSLVAADLPSVPNANLAAMNAWTIKMNNTSGSATPTDTTIDGLTLKASPLTTDEIPLWDGATSSMKKTTVSAVSGAGAVSSIDSQTGAFTTGVGIKSTGAEIQLTLSSAILDQSPSNPAAGNSTTSPLMMGLGKDAAGSGAHPCAITPVVSTRVEVLFYGIAANATSGNISTVQVSFGTGTAPNNGAAAIGTTVGATQPIHVAPAAYGSAFTVGGNITGLSVSTAYWFDIQLTSPNSTAATIANVHCIAHEIL